MGDELFILFTLFELFAFFTLVLNFEILFADFLSIDSSTMLTLEELTSFAKKVSSFVKLNVFVVLFFFLRLLLRSV